MTKMNRFSIETWEASFLRKKAVFAPANDDFGADAGVQEQDSSKSYMSLFIYHIRKYLILYSTAECTLHSTLAFMEQ